MHRSSYWKLLAIVAGTISLAACAPHKIYRTDYGPCISPQPELECRTSAIQDYRPGDGEAGPYLLGFIEFDDQGQVFERRQLRAVLDALFTEAANEDRDLLMVAFVHGWKHSAAPGDDNIRTFRKALEHLSATESRISRLQGTVPRRVIGVYLGWRGGSVTAPLIKELTFWDRKNTAHKVGHGGMTEVLSRLDLVRQTKNAVSGARGGGSRLVVVGHSFGGAVVFSALSQLLENRFVLTVGPAGAVTDAQGFGDLVVLINPAFEAQRFGPLSDMSTERGSYFDTQLPVLAVLTSEADDATGVAFPLGRSLSTLFENERVYERSNGVTGQIEAIDEGEANVTALGHFEPYRTHELRASGPEPARVTSAPAAEQAARAFFATSQAWERDAPGSEIRFPGSVLQRTDRSAGRNPYLVVRVDEALISDHNQIDDPRIISFVNQLILISSQSTAIEKRGVMREKGLE